MRQIEYLGHFQVQIKFAEGVDALNAQLKKTCKLAFTYTDTEPKESG
jgi:hypothetical protein